MFTKTQLLRARAALEERKNAATGLVDQLVRALDGVDALLAIHEEPDTHVAVDGQEAPHTSPITDRVITAIGELPPSPETFTHHAILAKVSDVGTKTVSTILRNLADQGIITIVVAGSGRRPTSYQRSA